MVSIKQYILAGLAGLLLLFPIAAFAQSEMDVPYTRTISYQGLLVNRDGFPLADGDHLIILRIYTDSLGTEGIWSSSVNVHTRNGLFNAILGAPYTEALPKAVDLNHPLWLGVQVDAHLEMRPLTPITGTMYALNVSDSSISTSKLQNNSINRYKLQDTSVTTQKIVPPFVGRIWVDSFPRTVKGGDFEMRFGSNMKWSVDSTDSLHPILLMNVSDALLKGLLTLQSGPGIRIDLSADRFTDTISVDTLGIAEYMLGNGVVTTRVLADNSVTTLKILDHEVHGIDVNRDIAGTGLTYGTDNKLHVQVDSGLYISDSNKISIDFNNLTNIIQQHLQGKIGVNPDQTRGIDTVGGKVFAKVDHATIGFNTIGEISLLPHGVHGVYLNGDVADNKTITYDAVKNVLTVKDGGISTVQIADSAITTIKIQDSAVTHEKLAFNSVDSTTIVDGGISYNDLSTTTINRLKSAIVGNRFAQALKLTPVAVTHDSTAVLLAAATDPGNNSPVVLASSASVVGGILFQGDATGATNGANLLQLRQSGSDKLLVNNAGDIAVNGTKLRVTAADGSLNIGPGNFQVNGASGATSIADAVTTSGFSLSVSNTTAGTNTAGAAQFTASNRTGFGTIVTRTTNGATFSATNASLNVTRGAEIDSLRLPPSGGLVIFDSGNVSIRNGTLDLTNTTITGIQSGNKYSQASTGATVALSKSIASGVEIQMSGLNADPAFIANSTGGGATGDLLQLQRNATPVFQVGSGGDVSVGGGRLVIAAASGATSINDPVSSSGFSLNVTNTTAGTNTAGAAQFTASNRTGFGTVATRTTNGALFSATNASLNVTRGAVIDSLRFPPSGGLLIVDGSNTSIQNSTLNLTNTTITGLSGINKFAQTATGAAVTVAPSVASGVEVQMSGTNADPAILANSSGGASTTGDLLQLQRNATPVFQVGSTGDVSVGGGKLVIAAASGATSINDPVSSSGFSFNVTNTTAGTNTAGAAQFTASNRTGFGTVATRTTNGATFSATNASLGVTRGANIDSLNISGRLQFSANTTADFTGATVTGLSGANKFTQTSTGGLVAIAPSVASGVEVLVSGTNADPAILANSSGGASTTGDLLQLQRNATPVFQVGSTGDVSVGGGKLVIAAASGATSINDPVSSSGFSLNVTNTTAGTNTAGAAQFTASNRTGFGTVATRTTNGATFSATNASLGVTRGANIDSLNISGRLQFSANTTADFTGATVTGLSGANKFTQTSTGGLVAIAPSVASGVEVLVSGTNADPAILANSSGGASTTGDLLQLQRNATPVFQVGSTGDVSVGGGKLVIAAASGATSINDPVSSSGFSLNVTNTTAGTNTAGAAQFTASNRTGFGTVATRTTNGATFSATNASLGVTRGANIDSLNISGRLQFSANTTADFTGATVTGLSGANKFTQTSTGGLVAIAPSVASGVEVLVSGTNADPAILANSSGGASTTGDLLQLQRNATPVFQVGSTGDVSVGGGKLVIAAASGATSINDPVSSSGFSFNVTNTTAGTNTAGAAQFTASNRTGFGTVATRTTNGATFSATNASLGVTRGANIDSLNISGRLQFSANTTADFTGATVTGLSTGNAFSQNATGTAVTVANSTAAGVLVQMTGTNSDPAIQVSSAAGASTSGDLLQMTKGGSTVVQVTQNGNTVITTGTGTSLSATTSSSTAGDAALRGTASAAGTSAVQARGNGVASAGNLNAAALEINNGAIRVTGAVVPIGFQAATIPAGTHTVRVTVNHVLVQANSLITVVVTGAGGSVSTGTDKDTYSGTVRSKSAGAFVIDVSCEQGDVPANEAVNIEYSIINQ